MIKYIINNTKKSTKLRIAKYIESLFILAKGINKLLQKK